MIVNNEVVEQSVIREEERMIRPRLREAMAGEETAAVEARVREWARENVIERVVLRQAALSDPEPIPAEAIDRASEAPGQAGARYNMGDENARREVEIRLRIDRLFERITSKLAPPRNKDVVEYYRKHREELAAPARVHAAHIVKNVGDGAGEAAAQAAIEDVERRLREGASFEALADQFSDCPGRGGDLGVFAPGKMVPEFDAVVFGMKAGEVSGIFRTPFGYHIAKVHRTYPEGVPELQEIREELEQLLFEQKKQRAIEQFLDRLIAKAEVREQ